MSYPGLTPDQRAKLSQVSESVHKSYYLKLVNNITEKCFKLCVQSNNSTLSNEEKQCIANCMDGYIKGANTITNIMKQ